MVAYVVRAPGGTVTADELRKHVEDTLRDEWVPQEVEFVAELPLTEFGKVDKKLLRDRFRTRVTTAP